MFNLLKKIKESKTYAQFMYSRTMDCKYIIDFLIKRKGIKIGKDCHIYTWISSPESYLISIGDNVTISTDVHFITHDNSICKVLPNYTDVFGRITIGNNCFIGANSLILLGVTLGDNTIVAAGSVVTKSFTGNVVIGGNPAKIITDAESYREKVKPYAINTSKCSSTEKKELLLHTTKLIQK